MVTLFGLIQENLTQLSFRLFNRHQPHTDGERSEFILLPTDSYEMSSNFCLSKTYKFAMIFL